MDLLQIPSAESLALPAFSEIVRDIISRKIISANIEKKKNIEIDSRYASNEILNELKEKGYHASILNGMITISWD